MSKGKVVIVGAGFVGASAAYATSISGIASELVLIDVNREKAIGEALDLNHGLTFMGQMKIYEADYSAVKDADVIVITAGTARKPGETRLDLVKRNAGIIKSMVPQIMEHYNGGVILVVANPVDVLTYLVQKLSGLPANKVISSGTLLDSSRFRYQLSTYLNVDVDNIHAYVLGEHGDSSVAIWSQATVGGEKIDGYCKSFDMKFGEEEKAKVLSEVREAGANVIKFKGATYYAIGLSIKTIVEAILMNKNTIMPVGTMLNGQYGINDVVVSVPSVVNAEGAKVLDITLSDAELAGLQASAKALQEIINEVK